MQQQQSSLSSLSTSHSLCVQVIEAKDLKPTNFFSSTSSDSFCELHLRDQIVKQTQVQYSSITPKWDETIQFGLPENPEEETLFLSVWGKHVISRNTFIGRIEIPISLVLKKESEDKFKENRRIERWFKLLPKAGNTQFSQVTGWIKLAFEYKYVPFVPASNPNKDSNNSMGGGIIVYKCPSCECFFPESEIQNHVNSCSGSLNKNNLPNNSIPVQQNTNTQHQLPPQNVVSQVPVQYNSPHSSQSNLQQNNQNPIISNSRQDLSSQQQQNISSSSPIPLNKTSDPTVPSGYSIDPSQPAPNSPPTFNNNFPLQNSSNPNTNPFVSNESQQSLTQENPGNLYAAPSYNFNPPTF